MKRKIATLMLFVLLSYQIKAQEFSTIQTEYVTVHFEKVLDQRFAEDLALGFKTAYEEVGKELNIFPEKKFVLYLFRSRENLVKALVDMGGFTKEEADIYLKGDFPRPRGNTFYLSIDAEWHDLVFLYTQYLIEMKVGDSFKEFVWLDFGFSEYEAIDILLRKEGFSQKEKRRFSEYQNQMFVAIRDKKLLSLSELSRIEDWNAKEDSESSMLRKAESYFAVFFLLENFGIEKIQILFDEISFGGDFETSFEKVFDVSVEEFEKDFTDELEIFYKEQREMIKSKAETHLERAFEFYDSQAYSNALIFFQRARGEYLSLGENEKVEEIDAYIKECEEKEKLRVDALANFEEAKKKYLNGKYKEAKELFLQARAGFEELNYADLIRETDEWIRRCDKALENENVGFEVHLILSAFIIFFLLKRFLNERV
ncbi:MAG: hypothetical protein ACE5HW_01485 [Candidatus Methanofastidiosia archaeon]